jgi:aryl-alcohol dehydrogenase-like predicted oxidoreductase
MRLTGPGVFGPPADWDEALHLLREVVDSGVNHIDTSEYYGPSIVNELISRALRPYPADLVLVSKVGARRGSRGEIYPYDEPAQLRRGIEDNLRSLKVDSLPVVNLRLMRAGPPDTFFDDQLAAMIAARDDGLIEGIGLSAITAEHLRHALTFTEISCVQNPYHVGNRRSHNVLMDCQRHGIAFVPFSPLGSGAASVLSGVEVRGVAARLGATPAQVALAWLLNQGSNVLLIPGTSTRRHLRENLGAARVALDADAMGELSKIDVDGYE